MNSRIQAHAYDIQLFFGIIKTHIFYLIQVVLIIFTFQKLWCLIIDGTYLFGFNHAEFIHHVVNNIMVLLFFMEPFSRYGISPSFLRRMLFSVLSSKYSQDLTFVIIMSSVIDHTGFWCALWVIYISFTALSRAPILRGVIVWRGGFSSIILTDSIMIGVCPSSFL